MRSSGLVFFVSFLLSFFSGLQLTQAQVPPASLRIKSFLGEFHQDPGLVMNRLPVKYDAHGIELSPPSQFDPQAIASRQFVALKDEFRKGICPNAEPGTACQKKAIRSYQQFDQIRLLKEFLNDGPVEKNLESLTRLGLKVDLDADKRPWSGDYFATYRGGVSARFNDSKYPSSRDFRNYIQWRKDNWPPQDLGTQSGLDRMSPAEKYDFLLGDREATLTEHEWSGAFDYFERYGKIESWFGICHGWAPAAMRMSRPQKLVSIPLKDGLNLNFLPDDLKALASLLWANSRLDVHFMGGRCDDKNPARDPESGRVVSPACWDANPAAWHMAVVQKLAVEKSSFVIDASYDYEVWNQPVVGMSISHFNVVSEEQVATVKESLVPLQAYTADKFRKFRSPKAKYVAGILMDLKYITETMASAAVANSPEEDRIQTVQYFYDLEIDADGNIVGGEWYQNAHPDFLWTPTATTQIDNFYDWTNSNDSWDGTSEVPASFRAAAPQASKSGEPLAKVMKKLFEMAR